MRRTTLMLTGALITGSLLAARPRLIDALPGSVYADTEVSTNVAFSFDRVRLDKLHLALECDATATNSLEVLVGHDVNADGRLSLEESDLAFGYDCGKWFTRETGTGVIQSTIEPRTGFLRRDLAINGRNVAPTWNLLKVIRRGPPAESSTVTLSVENRKFVISLR